MIKKIPTSVPSMTHLIGNCDLDWVCWHGKAPCFLNGFFVPFLLLSSTNSSSVQRRIQKHTPITSLGELLSHVWFICFHSLPDEYTISCPLYVGNKSWGEDTLFSCNSSQAARQAPNWPKLLAGSNTLKEAISSLFPLQHFPLLLI